MKYKIIDNVTIFPSYNNIKNTRKDNTDCFIYTCEYVISIIKNYSDLRHDHLKNVRPSLINLQRFSNNFPLLMDKS